MFPHLTTHAFATLLCSHQGLELHRVCGVHAQRLWEAVDCQGETHGPAAGPTAPLMPKGQAQWCSQLNFTVLQARIFSPCVVQVATERQLQEAFKTATSPERRDHLCFIEV